MGGDCPSELELRALAAGAVPAELATQLRRHVGRCSPCSVRLNRSEASDAAGAGTITSQSLPADGPGPAAAPAGLQVVAPERYAIHGEHARGGIGRILRAEDRRLRRPVAVKELLGDRPAAARRFAREAALTARLQHPSIVPVYEAGVWPDGRPFYAMKFISGRPLSELIAAAPTLAERLALLPHLIAVAEAIAYAHSKRVIHRDLKPSNILVGEFGETLVVDWGLGKELGAADEPDDGAAARTDDDDQTVTGTLIGTPAFMAPEQAQRLPVDERADVYALGAILYTLLAGRAPYGRAATAEVLAAVVAQTAPPLLEVQPGVAPDLIAIVAKAMAAAPADRYADAAELARDLKRFESGQLVGVRRYSARELAARWLLRHRLPVTLTAAFVLALATLGGLSLRRIVRERALAERRSNELIVAGARASLDRDPTAALAWLEQYPLDGASWDQVRDVALQALSAGVARYLRRSNDEWILFPAVSPDGTQLALPTGRPDDRIDLRDLRSGRLVRSLPAEPETWLVRWSRDGRWLVGQSFVSEATRVQWWDLDSGARKTVSGLHVEGQLAVSDDGAAVAYADGRGVIHRLGRDGTSRVLDRLAAPVVELRFVAADGTLLAANGAGELHLCPAQGDCRRWQRGRALAGARLSPDGQRLLDWGAGAQLRRRDDDGVVLQPPGELPPLASGRFSPDGNLIALGGADRLVRLWDWRHGGVRELAGDDAGLVVLEFSPDGRRLASGAKNGTIRVWDLATGTSVRLRGHSQSIEALSWGADGDALLSAAADRTTRLWAVPRAPLAAQSLGQGTIVALQPLDQSRLLASESASGTLSLVDPLRQARRVLTRHGSGELRFVVSADGRRVASDGHDGAIMVADSDGDGPAARYASAETSLWVNGFAGDGRTLLVAGGDARERLLDLQRGELRIIDDHCEDAFFTPEGNILMQDDRSYALTLRDGSGAQLARWPEAPTYYLQSHAFSPDGSAMLTVEYDGHVRRWERARGRAQEVARVPPLAKSNAQSRDGGAVAVADHRGGGLGLYQFADSSWRWTAHQGRLYAVAFSPDGTRLLTGGADHQVRIWDAATLALLQVIDAGSAIASAAFLADGSRVAAGDNGGLLRVWRRDPASEAPAAADPARLRAWLRAQTSAALLERDGEQALASP